MSIGGYENSLLESVGAPARLEWSMGMGVKGSYDNRILRPGGESSWRKQPNNVELQHRKMFVPFGTPLPLQNEEMYQYPPNNPMFIFSNNVASLDCCPSTYSTDGGCICSTKKQRKYIGERRGNNKSYPSDSF